MGRSRMHTSKRMNVPAGGGGMRRMDAAAAQPELAAAQPTKTLAQEAPRPAAAAAEPVMQRVAVEPATARSIPAVAVTPPEQLADTLGLDEMD